ncbi:helix-turn-helix domain-containing protein [Lacticaseibacillus sp. NRC_P2]|nr:helix-turn-helix domain-containing protein [Lacticaseibacillus casei]
MYLDPIPVSQGAPDVIHVTVSPQNKIQMAIYLDGNIKPVTCAQLPNASAEQLTQLFDRASSLLAPTAELQDQLTQLAIKAITADFKTIFEQSARALNNPLVIVNLLGQVVLKAVPNPANRQQLTTVLNASQLSLPLKHLHVVSNSSQIIMPTSNGLHLPLLFMPLAYHNDALGYLIMPALTTAINAIQIAKVNGQIKVIISSLVKNRVMPTAASKRDYLLTMLLTEQQTTTFAAQFARENATLPASMVLIKAEPQAGQSLASLKERLKYLLTPLFSQVLITIYHHHCLVLISIDLPTYNSYPFKAKLIDVANRADCRLIVSNQYARPEDTIAAYAVFRRTAKLKLPPDPVTFCEDAFFDLLLGQVDHVEILPFFINPAVKTLMAYDADNKTELVRTLDAYLEYGENLTHTAKHLYIHFNTLRYRLNHISELTGLNLKDAETCFKLGASFKVRCYLEHRQLLTHHPK